MDTRGGRIAQIDNKLNDKNKFVKYIYKSTESNEFQNNLENKLKAKRVFFKYV